MRKRHPNRPIWDEEPGLLAKLTKGATLFGIVMMVLFPLWTIIITSFSTQKAITEAGGLVVVPTELSIDAYRQIFSGGVVTNSIKVSVFITVVGTLVSMVISVLGAFALSRPGSVLHKPILFYLLITMFFSAGMIPTYLLVVDLKLIDSLWALILPGSVSAFNIMLLRNFFMGIDQAMLESARIDGASDWRILGRIVLPLSKAVLAVISLFYAVTYWNAFFNAMLYINDTTKWPLQLVLRSYVLQGQALTGGDMSFVDGAPPPGLAVQMAVVVIAMVPILIVYPFIQKHFATGVMIGAVKG